MSARTLLVAVAALHASGCASAFLDFRVGGYFPTDLHGAKPGLGTDVTGGARLVGDLGVHGGAGVYYLQDVPTGCQPGALTDCTGPGGEFDSQTGGLYVMPVMAGLKYSPRLGDFDLFLRGEVGLVYAEYSHLLELEKDAAFAWRIGGGVLFKRFGVEGGLLRSDPVTFSKTVRREYKLDAYTLSLSASF